jgi:hypothetical protein
MLADNQHTVNTAGPQVCRDTSPRWLDFTFGLKLTGEGGPLGKLTNMAGNPHRRSRPGGTRRPARMIAHHLACLAALRRQPSQASQPRVSLAQARSLLTR